MKSESFFEKFDLFADVPGAVAQMRGLVLRLASCGKLVEQSPDDEPASALVTRIEHAFEKKRARKEIRSSAVEPLSREGLPRLPSSWTWVRLGNVVDYGSSDKADSADIPDDAWLLDLEDIERDTSRLLQRKRFHESPSKSTKTAFIPGDVLYGKLRPYLNKVVVADAPGYCTTEIVPIRAFGFIEPAYLCYALKRPEFVAYANSKSYGMNLPRLGTEDARRAPFPLPPFAEQKHIVAKVDELMALCDRMEVQQQEREARHTALARASLARFADAPTPANLKYFFHPSYTISPTDLRKSILTLAVQGNLAPQDPTDEAVAHLLGRNDEERRTVARDDHRADSASEPLLSADDRWDIPDSWRWRALADLVLFVDYRGKTPVKVSSGVRLLTAKNVRKGQINLEPEEFLSETEYAAWMTRGFPKTGDVLFTTEAPMGNAAIVQLTERFSLAQRVICFQGYGALDPEFLVLQILSERFQAILDKNGTGVTAKGIKASKLKQLPIAVPPLPEQRRISAKVGHLMTLVDTLEQQLASSSVTADNLLNAVVAEVTAAG
jgi:type I restriction enzyme S subunit